jgi:hypothetical protein
MTPHLTITKKTLVALVAAAMALSIQACQKGITNEERLERTIQRTDIGKLVASSEFSSLRCDDAPGVLFKARDEAKPEGERLKTYVDLYLSLLDRKKKLDDTIARNPDMAYQEGAQAVLDSQEACTRQVTEVRIETERFIRDLVDTPTVQEIKGGNITVSPRVEFEILRRAIEAIEIDGKQELLKDVETAEQKLGPLKSSSPPRPKR